MGMYVYRLTKKRVPLSDGSEANVAVYAYKPYWNDYDGMNAKLAFRSGCVAAERIKSVASRIVLGEMKGGVVSVPDGASVFDNPNAWRTFYDDDALGVAGKLPRVPGVFSV